MIIQGDVFGDVSEKGVYVTRRRINQRTGDFSV